MRKSIDGLCGIITEQLKAEPEQHSIYIFCGRRCDRIKILLKEPDGVVLLYKRLNVIQGRIDGHVVQKKQKVLLGNSLIG